MGDMKKPKFMKVKGVRDEYEFIRAQSCDNCGLKGTYKMQVQKLAESFDGLFDIVECACSECGDKKDFIFDVNEIFKGF